MTDGATAGAGAAGAGTPGALTAAELLRAVRLMADGPVVWGRPVPARGPGVFVVEWPWPRAAAPIELTRVGKWLQRVPELQVDGVRPSSRALSARLAAFWIPSATVLYVGATATSIAGRISAMERTVLGDRRPYSGGHWLKTLVGMERARVWWATTNAIEEYEDALLNAFAASVSAAELASLPDREIILPFANLRTATGDRKRTGLSSSLLAAEPARVAPPTHVVEVPPGEADGASGLPPTRAGGGTVRRTPRPRVAATGSSAPSPRRGPPPAAPTYLSADGITKLREEHEVLVTARRPEVIGRIRAAKELGDLKENADYAAAREEQSFLEGRIATIETLLRDAVVIQAPTAGPEGRVGLGSNVTIEETDGAGETVRYEIVGSTEADPAAGRISNASPVGRALLGRAAGESVVVRTPRGEARYRIVSIE